MFFRPAVTRSLIVLRTSPEPSPSVIRPARSTIETSPAWRTVAFVLIQYLRQSLCVLSDINTLTAPVGGNFAWIPSGTAPSHLGFLEFSSQEPALRLRARAFQG